MRRASILAAVLSAAGGLLLANVASAQSDPRLLSWPGRGDATPPQTVPVGQPQDVRRDVRRPNPVIPHGAFAAPEAAPRGLTPAPGPARRTLTPANAWLRPAQPARAPAAAPAPVPSAPAAASPSAPPPPPPPPPARSAPEYLPDQGGRSQPAPADLVFPDTAPPPAASTVDPMAPRRDAPIFRLQQSAPPPAPRAAPAPEQVAATAEEAPAPQPRVMQMVNSGEAPPAARGGRYYSVHRQNGRQPDALTMPQPTYVDGLVVSEVETLASQDLAAPQEGPTLIRDRNGNLRAAPAPSDGDHQ